MSSAASVRPELLGSEVPRIFTPPLRELTPATSLGFSCIAFAETVLGVRLFPWQKWVLIHALELLPSGDLRFRTVILLVGRQNGKSLLAQVLAAWWLWVCGVSVLGTAQDLPTAEDVWQAVCEFALDTDEHEAPVRPALRREVVRQSLRNGQRELVLRGGRSYKVKAANRKAARGKASPKAIIDELREQRTWDAWAAITKVTIAQEDGQVWGMSNAGDRTSVVLRRMRMLGHARLGDPDGIVEAAAGEPGAVEVTAELGDGDDALDADELALGIFEWSAAPGLGVMDRLGWAQSNPATGHGTITERALAAAARTDPEHVFRGEVLCQWQEDATRPGPFPAGATGRATIGVDPRGELLSRIELPSRIVASVDVSWSRSTATVAVCGAGSGGTAQAEVVARQAGTQWLVDWFCDPRRPHRAGWPIVVSRGSAAWALIDAFRAAGLTVIEWKGDDLPTGVARFYDAVAGGEVRWAPDPGLLVAARTAQTSGGGRGNLWLWDRKESPSDIAPLVAVNGAWWGWSRPPEPPPAPAEPARRTKAARKHVLVGQGF